jgi:hypothetical protein
LLEKAEKLQFHNSLYRELKIFRKNVVMVGFEGGRANRGFESLIAIEAFKNIIHKHELGMLNPSQKLQFRKISLSSFT